MSELIRVSEAATMGIHAMAYLAAHSEKIVPLKEVADRLAVSENHLSKVLQRLGKAELVKATRGPTGGYLLARPSKGIRLLEIFEAIDGPIRPKFCLFSESVCVAQCCGLGELIGRQNQEVKDFLDTHSLAEIAGIFGKRSKS